MGNIPVFISADDRYAPYAAVAIASAAYNTSAFLNFYVIGEYISSVTQKRIKSLEKQFNNLRIDFMDAHMDMFNSFKKANELEGKYWSNTTYARILIPVLKLEIDKAINLDSDTLVLGDLQEMIDIDMEGYALAATPDNYVINDYIVRNGNYLDFSPKHLKKYFNAGVLLFDCKKWRENDITGGLFELQNCFRDKIVYVEQDLLNKYFDNNYKVMNSKFNLANSAIATLIEYPEMFHGEYDKQWDCVVRHFEGPLKPWRGCHRVYGSYEADTLFFDEFWFYAKMTDFFAGMDLEFELTNLGRI